MPHHGPDSPRVQHDPLADDGKRWDALDVILGGRKLIYKGGSLREGGQNVLTDGRAGG